MTRQITMSELVAASRGEKDFGGWVAVRYADHLNQESREQIEEPTWAQTVATYADDDPDPVTLLYAGEWDGRTQWDS